MDGSQKKFCTSCGVALFDEVKFCPNCGKSVPVSVQLLKEEDEELSGNDWSDFVGKNQPFYLRKFEEMRLKGTWVSWNWPAFFFGPLWFIYRKMYLYAVIAFVIGWVSPWGVLLMIASGMFGNVLYRNWIEKELRFTYHLDEQRKREHLLSRGGVNALAAWLIGGGLMVLFFLVLLFACLIFVGVARFSSSTDGYRLYDDGYEHFDSRWREKFDSPWNGPFD